MSATPPPGFIHVTLALNGTLPFQGAAPGQILLRPGTKLICADGAANSLAARGIAPHCVVGDLDSINAETLAALQAAQVEIVRHPHEKDETDGELALEVALAASPDAIEILGIDGGRFDMMFANLALLLHPKLARLVVQVRFADESLGQLMTPKVGMNRAFDSHMKVSLLALTETVRIEEFSGVKWPLRDEVISRSSARTLSNIVVGATPVVCRVVEGRALLVWHTRSE